MNITEGLPVRRDVKVDDGELPTPPAIIKKFNILNAGRKDITANEFITSMNFSALLVRLEQKKIPEGKGRISSIQPKLDLLYQP